MTLAHDMTGDAGSTAPDVVLLHSTVCDRRMWEPQWHALADAGHRVVRADFRAFGGTPPSNVPYRDADDVIALMDALGIERAALVGSSYGGRIALEIAARDPTRVSALALLCAGLPGQEESEEVAAFERREVELVEDGDVADAAAFSARTWLGPEADPATLAAVTRMQLEAYELQLSADYHGYEGTGDFDPTALRAVTAPALVVSGAHDMPDFRRSAARLADLLPTACHRELPWAGHLPSLERPDEITGLLLRHIALIDRA
ncbi:alpha/beta fold hydrolase [Streptomyces sp. NPDC004726]